MIPPMYQQSGFTLVELIMVIVISSILAVGTTRFIAQTSDSFIVSSQRLTIATTAGLISEKISREVRSALPNSIRIFADGTNSCLEFIPVVNSSEYLSVPLAAAENSFQIVPLLAGLNRGYVSVYPSSTSDIYNSASNTVTQVQATVSVVAGMPGIQEIVFDGAANVQFATGSPTQRVYLTSQPVAFCEDNNGFVWRYFDYGFHNNSAAQLPPASNRREVIGNSLQVGSLEFKLAPAQLQRNAVVRISMIVTSPRSESVAIAQEVQLRNVP